MTLRRKYLKFKRFWHVKSESVFYWPQSSFFDKSFWILTYQFWNFLTGHNFFWQLKLILTIENLIWQLKTHYCKWKLIMATENLFWQLERCFDCYKLILKAKKLIWTAGDSFWQSMTYFYSLTITFHSKLVKINNFDV